MTRLCFGAAAIYIAALILAVNGCQSEPGDVGLSFISPNDTTGVKYLDSVTDSLTVTSSTYEKAVNTYGATFFFVGKYEQFESKSALKFVNIPADYDSATVLSASINLRAGDVVFQNKTGITDFTVYKILTGINLATVTIDSITSSTVGTTPLGSYSGVVPDTQFISVPIDNQTVKDWLEYAADTSYAQKNYGIMLQPTSASTTIRGFYSFNNQTVNLPYLSVVLTKNGETDTIKIIAPETVSLSDAQSANLPPERMLVQNGIAYRTSMTYDLSKLPSNVIINNAKVELHLDSKASYISESGSRTLVFGLINDTSGFGDTLFTNAFPQDSVTYSVSVNQIFQNWNSGFLPNLGLSIKGSFELQNLDRFIFYSNEVADTTLRPRLKIYYTLRN